MWWNRGWPDQEDRCEGGVEGEEHHVQAHVVHLRVGAAKLLRVWSDSDAEDETKRERVSAQRMKKGETKRARDEEERGEGAEG